MVNTDHECLIYIEESVFVSHDPPSALAQSTSGEQVTQSNYSDALRGQAEGCRITSVDALDDRTSRSTRASTYYTSYSTSDTVL